MIGETGLNGNFLNAESGVLQQLLGGIDTALVEIFIRRHTVNIPETADGLGDGQICDFAAFFQRNTIAQVNVQILLQQGNVSGNRLFQFANFQVIMNVLAQFQKNLTAFVHNLIDVTIIRRGKIVNALDVTIGVQFRQVHTVVDAVGFQNRFD